MLAANAPIAAKLMRLFELRFDVAAPRDPEAEEALREEILADLDAVASLDHDRILRNQLGLIEATVRTNAYQPGRGAIAFKLRSDDVPAIPRPAPLFEIYVYSPEVEGIHLRGGKIARGGLRWSDRMDYRTEVYGLMRAQMTKNAVIVPEGAKGGFYLKHPPADPAELRAEVERQYIAFISGLLDVTDNRVDGGTVHPEGVRILDEEDSYLVVAADKGTATFSDTANAISERYGFWLGDAFASGGSKGYDHKKLGITARGAWESAKRHLRELDIDPARDEFTVVGIGDMSGDVFGNGMLLSDKIRLVAAYDHRHVFIDPDPDAATSHAERRRLFDLPGSSWDDYDRSLISEGGGVWPRAAKSILLSEQVRAALGIEEEALPPNEVIRAILRAPVTMLFNGGIGTVVKASTETDADALDRSSDSIRVDAAELRCRVVAEGGNLGLTQNARIEFARRGGLVNADFIDNSAGVDSSDHEVNLKILLGLAVRRGELAPAERDELLAAVTDDVVRHVLYDSFLQAQILAQEVRGSASRMFAYEDLMNGLDQEGILDREAERLPGSHEMADRARAGVGMTRPELAVLLAYAKRSLTGAPPAVGPARRAGLRGGPGRILPAADRRALRPSARRAPAAPRAGRDDRGQRRRRLARAHASCRAWWPSAGRSRPRSCGPTASPAASPGPRALGGGREARHRRSRGAVGADGRRRLARRGRDALVPGEGARRGHRRRRSRSAARPSSACRPRCARRSPTRATKGRARMVADLVSRGVPEHMAARARLADGAAPGARRDRGGPLDRPAAWRTSRAPSRTWTPCCASSVLEDQLETLPAVSRLQRWAVQGVRDDVLDARRHLAERALLEAADESPEEAVDAFVRARSRACSRAANFALSLRGDGTPDLAGVTLAVRQLRAVVEQP